MTLGGFLWAGTEPAPAAAARGAPRVCSWEQEEQDLVEVKGEQREDVEALRSAIPGPTAGPGPARCARGRSGQGDEGNKTPPPYELLWAGARRPSLRT